MEGKTMDKDIEKVLITEEQIRSRVAELGEELTRDYEGKDPVIVGVPIKNRPIPPKARYRLAACFSI